LKNSSGLADSGGLKTSGGLSDSGGLKTSGGLADSGGLKISGGSVPVPVTQNLKPSDSSQDQAAKRSSGPFATTTLSVEQPTQNRRSSTGLVNVSARAYYESLVNEMTIAYAATKDSRAKILHVTIKKAVNEWRRLKEEAIDQEQLFSVVNDKYLAYKECFDRATKSKEEATSELARLRASYLLSEENKWETQSGTPLLIDEIAHLQEIQALVDLREAEFKLASYDLQQITEQKVVAETPLEMAQGALWKAVAELKRLGLTENDAATWDNEQIQYPTTT